MLTSCSALHHQRIDGKFHQNERILLFSHLRGFLYSVAAAPMSIYFQFDFCLSTNSIAERKKYGVFDVRARNHNTDVFGGDEKSKQNKRVVRSMSLHIFHIYC